MGAKSHISIAWQGLSNGFHEYEFEIDDSFFKNIEYSEFSNGQFKLEIELIRKPQLMTLNFHFEGYVTVLCDRCLDNFEFPMNFQSELIVKIGLDTSEVEDNIIYIKDTDHELQLSHYIYESIVLELPLKRTHPDDTNGNSTCNSDMLNKIENLNNRFEEKKIDPRWEKLRKLK